MKPLSLTRRKVRALRIFKQPAFRRNLPTPAVTKEALEFFKKHLTNFNSFMHLTTKIPGIGHDETIRIARFKNTEFVIKDTAGDLTQGYTRRPLKNNAVRMFIKMHHTYFRRNGLRAKAKYILRTPRLFGTIGNFLIIERIREWHPKTREEIDTVELAKDNLEDMFQNLAASNRISKPQADDFIPAGIHNGKVVFYTVYDFL